MSNVSQLNYTKLSPFPRPDLLFECFVEKHNMRIWIGLKFWNLLQPIQFQLDEPMVSLPFATVVAVASTFLLRARAEEVLADSKSPMENEVERLLKMSLNAARNLVATTKGKPYVKIYFLELCLSVLVGTKVKVIDRKETHEGVLQTLSYPDREGDNEGGNYRFWLCNIDIPAGSLDARDTDVSIEGPVSQGWRCNTTTRIIDIPAGSLDAGDINVSIEGLVQVGGTDVSIEGLVQVGDKPVSQG